ncbi:MAG: TrmB family transcriptional regulator [Anaerolineae bacterium]|jgi:Cd2+/Zn2+-exporting ATPase
MESDPIEKLMALGFSEYEAKAYVALLRESPVTGYQLSKLSGVPRSMIYEVMGKLIARGAAMTLRQEGVVRYAPIPPEEFLDQLHREHEALITALQQDLSSLTTALDLEYVWNIEGRENILAKAEEMVRQARWEIYLSLTPATFPPLRPGLLEAIRRGVRVVVYSPESLDLPGGQVVIAPVSEEAQERVEGLWLILVVDEKEVLIGEQLEAFRARASWTSSPLLVFIAEHHLRTDPYLPQILACLGDRAGEIIREEDRELFARAMESHVGKTE